jgi:DNA-binding NarL/FixJ family response regulator
MGAQLATAQGKAETDLVPGVDVRVRVLVIDGSDQRRQLTAHIVEQDRDVTVVGYADGSVRAREALTRLGADAVVLEVQLPVAQGLDTISDLRENFPALAIIVCSFHGDAATKRAASARGADGYLVKPLSPRDLHASLRSALQSRAGRSLS